MKRLILLTALFLCFTLFVNESVFAQAQFETGKLGVIIGSYGRVRVYIPDVVSPKNIERISILVGTAPDAVFDYQNDVDVEESVTLVENPALSDMEITGVFNNAYSSQPPDILEKLTVYGWQGGGFLLLKFDLTSREASTINAVIGLDVITQIDGTYGYDTITYVADNKVIDMHKENHVGLKLLSHELKSLTSFEWYSNYSIDNNYYGWLTHETIDPEYISGEEGPVVITAQDPIELNNGESVTVYYALAVGADRNEMLDEMSTAEAKYNTITSVEKQLEIPVSFSLEQNYPNPFNPTTRIKFSIPSAVDPLLGGVKDRFVMLKIYDVLGNEITTLVNEQKSPGTYEVEFDAGNFSPKGSVLTSGIYFYTINVGDFKATRKMILMR
jgi:hypothetical protein